MLCVCAVLYRASDLYSMEDTVLYGFPRKACIRTEVDEERLKRKKTKQNNKICIKKSSENGVKNGFKKRFMNFF